MSIGFKKDFFHLKGFAVVCLFLKNKEASSEQSDDEIADVWPYKHNHER